MSHEYPRLAAFLSAHPEIEFLDIAVADMGGQWRGKRMLRADVKKLYDGDVKLPLTVVTADLWGEENVATGLSAAGDVDGLARIIDAPPLMDPASPQRAFLAATLLLSDGAAFYGDARQVLGRMQARLQARGLQPVVATEIEFYLLKPESLEAGAPIPPGAGASSVYSMDDIESADGFLSDLFHACRAAEIPADGALAEFGPAQYEMNLSHRADALLAADDAIRLRWLIRRVARQHGFLAAFLPKLWEDRSGCGQHAHVSLLDIKTGANVFDDGGPAGAAALRHAIGGVLDLMPESTLCFAPLLSSYRRMRDPNYLSPTTLSWGYDSRFPAVRVPSGAPKARRLEHRAPGADANPYVMLAAVLAGVEHGIATEADPGAPMMSWQETFAPHLKRVPLDWGFAIDLFEASRLLAEALSPEFVKYYAGQKRREKRRFDEHLTALEFRSMVDAI